METISRDPPEQRLVHQPSGSYIRFKYIEDDHPARIHKRNTKDHHVAFRPARTADQERRVGPLSWDGALSCVQAWLEIVREEAEVSDLWTQLRDSRARIEGWGSDQEGSEPFDPEEQKNLREKLDEFEEWVRERFDLQGDQFVSLHQHVEDLREQVSALKRRQWASMALGVVLRVGVDLGFSNSAFSEIVSFFDDLLAGVPELPRGG